MVSGNRTLFFIIFAISILSFSTSSISVKGDARVLSEIKEDFTTDIILLYVETPNKFDRTYTTNITDKVVLDEISAVENALNSQRDDNGDMDGISYILSISTLIKENNEAPENVWFATAQELDPNLDPGPPPGDFEYEIPEDQDEIDEIIDQIPPDIKNQFTRDTNDDGVWDTAIVLIGVNDHFSSVKRGIDRLIEKYEANSGEAWWDQIIAGEIHCRMTNLDYIDSFSDDSSNNVTLIISITIIIVLAGLMLGLFSMIKSHPNAGDEGSSKKKKMLAIAIVFLILIVSCISIIVLDISPPQKVEVTQYSEEFGGGQIGMVLVRGPPAPGLNDPNQHTNGLGSMKDIEVLDAIDQLEIQLERIDNPPLSSSLTIVDIMKMIQVPETFVARIPMDMLPAAIQDGLLTSINRSFWDAIHVANDDENSVWNLIYGKTQQESMINIFYNSITPELRSIFVNTDFSKSLLYITIPLLDTQETEDIENDINQLHRNYSAGSSTGSALIGGGNSKGLGAILKIWLLFILLAVGIISFVLFHFKIRQGDKGGKQEPQQEWPGNQYYQYNPPLKK